MPAECLQVADDNCRLTDLANQAVQAARDLNAGLLSDLVRQIGEAQQTLTQHADTCRAGDSDRHQGTAINHEPFRDGSLDLHHHSLASTAGIGHPGGTRDPRRWPRSPRYDPCRGPSTGFCRGRSHFGDEANPGTKWWFGSSTFPATVTHNVWSRAGGAPWSGGL